VKKVLATLGLLAVVFLAFPAEARPAFDALSAEETARVERGDIVVNVENAGGDVKHFRVVGLVNASAQRTYDVFTNFAKYDEIFHVKDSRILKHEGNVMHVRATITVPWPIGDRWVTNETRLEPEALSFSFNRIDGTIVSYSGYVKAVPKGADRCYVYYVAKADPGIPFLPAWLLNQFQASMLPDTIKHVRTYLQR
jgi:ribosome-associated toxin RatA of RatAB toxin-antitoxin module